MKQSIALLVAIAAAAVAECDWDAVDKEACKSAGTVAACFPAGWPSCTGVNWIPTLTETNITTIVEASCEPVAFFECYFNYPDLEEYYKSVPFEPSYCAGAKYFHDQCADDHCTDETKYPKRWTDSVNECKAKGKNDFVTKSGEEADRQGIESISQEEPMELRRRQNGGLLTGDIFPVGPSCAAESLTTCLRALPTKYENCTDPFTPCLCAALFDIQACYTKSCTSPADQPTIVTNNIGGCRRIITLSGVASPASTLKTTTTSTTSTKSITVLGSGGRDPTATISPTGTITILTTTSLTALLPTRSPLSSISPLSTISFTSTKSVTSSSSTNTYRQIEFTSTTSTTTQIVPATSSGANPNLVSTSTTLVPSTTVSVKSTTTSTASAGAAATMGGEMGIGAMAAAALGFAAML